MSPLCANRFLSDVLGPLLKAVRSEAKVVPFLYLIWSSPSFFVTGVTNRMLLREGNTFFLCMM